MGHHWRASDGLVRTGGGEWTLYDRGRLVGYIQYGRVAKRPALRAVIKQGELVQVIGYADSLEKCCTNLWNWYVRFVVAEAGHDPATSRL
jgi:hypothetical protein